MELSQYHPRSVMVTKSTPVDRPRFPVIDAHNHLGEEYGGGWIEKPLDELLVALDQAGVYGYVDLDGGWGEDILAKHLARLKTTFPERFRVFGGVNWSAWQEKGDGFPRWAANRMHAQADMGADGLKIWKLFGLKVRDHHNALVAVDDSRLDPIWEAAADLGWPVTIHIADPVAFFDPLDEHNERWEELHAFPDWQFPSPPF
ncbi:MAG: amidohydrolase family protein, partial [Anaerolineaceae bacterium]|nr:amidohydrolase family protein [Anaerolineaceae bacterium]